MIRWKRCRLRSLVLAVALAVLALPAAAAESGRERPLILEKQGSFFLGGRNVRSEDLSTLPNYAAAGTITIDQVYVRYQHPVDSATSYPLALIHGCCLTGKSWETTPDGRMGWDEFFVRQGFPVYVIDQAWRGRSAADPSRINAVRSGKSLGAALPEVFAAGQEDAWKIFRFGSEYPKSFPNLQFPLEALDEFWKQMVPDWTNALPSPNPTLPALAELAQKINGAILISHSQSGIYPFRVAATDRRGIAGIVAIEPGSCPEAAGDMAAYRNLPILVLFGDFVELSSRWAPRLKACREFVKAAKAADSKAELVLLPEIGISGNSHMLMQDKNSLAIAAWLADWINKNVGTRKPG